MALQAEDAEKVAVMVHGAPLAVPVKLKFEDPPNGALNTCGAPPQLLTIVKVPLVGGLVMFSVPVSVYKLLLQFPGLAVKPVTPQIKEQSAEPVPPVCEKLIFPAWLA